MILAPFFGIRNSGVARWMNRILILIELAVPALLCYVQYTDPFGGVWMYAVIMAVCYFGASVLNGLLRWLNGLLVIPLYGTIDPDEIVSVIRESEEKRRGLKRAAQ